MRLALYGGRFDPLHIGHLLLAETARVRLELDQIWFIPSKAPPHKTTTAPAETRYEIALLATADNPHFRVSRLELDRAGTSYTVDTVETVKKQHPDAELFYLTGTDAYAHIATWERARELVEMVQMVALARPGVSLDKLESTFLDRVKVLETPLFEVSSTDIRQRLKAGQSGRYLLSDSVAAYIAKHRLYQELSPPLTRGE